MGLERARNTEAEGERGREKRDVGERDLWSEGNGRNA